MQCRPVRMKTLRCYHVSRWMPASERASERMNERAGPGLLVNSFTNAFYGMEKLGRRGNSAVTDVIHILLRNAPCARSSYIRERSIRARTHRSPARQHTQRPRSAPESPPTPPARPPRRVFPNINYTSSHNERFIPDATGEGMKRSLISVTARTNETNDCTYIRLRIRIYIHNT